MVRGAELAVGRGSISAAATAGAPGTEGDPTVGGVEGLEVKYKGSSGWLRARAAAALPLVVCWGRGIAGWIAGTVLRAFGWDLSAESAFPRIPGRKVQR